MDIVLDKIEARGKEIGLLEAIRSLMRTAKCSAEQAIELLEIPVTERGKYLSKL